MRRIQISSDISIYVPQGLLHFHLLTSAFFKLQAYCMLMSLMLWDRKLGVWSYSNRIKFYQMSVCLLLLPLKTPFRQLRKVTTMTLWFTMSLFSSMPSKLIVSQYLMKSLDHNGSIKTHQFIICTRYCVLRLLLHCQWKLAVHLSETTFSKWLAKGK